jgi:DNA-binding NarL/FixJ family response regulator
MKLLIVDDHPLLRDGLAAILRQAEPTACILQARDALEGLDLLDQNFDLDVVILDLMMPGLGGLPAIGEFGRKRPDLPVIVLSASEDRRDARKALALGARGYVAKSASQHTLLSAIRRVLSGDRYIPSPIFTRIDAAAPHPEDRTAGGAVRLTERQVDVLRLLSEGRSNKEIALALILSEKTVKVHITAVFKALNVVNRTQAAIVGRETGLI